MKNIILILTLFTCTVSFSQKKKGDFLIKKKTTEITGDISLLIGDDNYNSETFYSGSERQTFSLSFSPNFGYAIKDNLIVGIGARYGHSYSKQIFYDEEFSENKSNSNLYSVFPYIKKYFPLGKKVALSLRGEIGYSHLDQEYYGYSPDALVVITSNKHDDYFIGLRPGVNLFITPKIMLKANLGYIGYTTSERIYNIGNENEREHNNKEFNFLLNSTQFSAGLTFLLI